jgi:ABC-type sulfate/molybdate transport systems ATPase subunit
LAHAREEAAVLDFSLESRRGSFHLQLECRFSSSWIVIFGPSGAGKSTLLRLLAGLDRPVRGQIKLDDRTLTHAGQKVFASPGKRQTALVAQQPALFPHLSVAANVSFGVASLDARAREARVAEMLTLVGAEHLVERRPRDLSGGEAQRIALARSLAPLPRLLLLDEPFSALDGDASDALLMRLQGWVAEHRIQTVMATHDAADAFALGAEVVLLKEGRLAGIGPAPRVLQSERERIVVRLQLPSS